MSERHLCTDFELCPGCLLCEGCCVCSLDDLADAIVAEALDRAEPCAGRAGPCAKPALHALYALASLERLVGVVPEGGGAIVSVLPDTLGNSERKQQRG